MNGPRYHEIGVCGMCRRTFRADRLAGGLCPECRERNRPNTRNPGKPLDAFHDDGAEERVCGQCGRTFWRAPHTNRRYCCVCASERRRRRNGDGRSGGDAVAVRCADCGRTFTAYTGGIGRTVRFCAECARKRVLASKRKWRALRKRSNG